MKVSIPTSESWLTQRQKQWTEFEYAARDDDSKAVLETFTALKAWFLQGDLAPLIDIKSNINADDYLELSSVMEMCPCQDLDECIEFFKDYAMWQSKEKMHYWGRDKEIRDRRFIKYTFNTFSVTSMYSTNEIYSYFLSSLMPDENSIITFPFSLGEDDWTPKSKVIEQDLAVRVLRRVCRYLFEIESESIQYAHTKLALPFVAKNINKIDAKYFDTVLLTRPYKTYYGKKINSAGQELMRSYIANLQGHKTDFEDYDGPLIHNDIEVEAELKNIFDSAEMPKEYYKLLEFIDEHKGDCVKK